MPRFDVTTRGKIEDLRALRAAGTTTQVYELALVEWPEDPIYYSTLALGELDTPPDVDPIELRLIPNSRPNWFVPVQLDSTIGDEEVDLEFWDGDGVFSDLLVEHGEGVRVTLYYWLPQVELLLPIWYGHLRQEEDAEIDICKIKAVQGFRSSEGLLPKRAHWRECQAIFGGVLDTQEEIDEHDCPYNRHIGGGVGLLNGGVPFTSCPRRTRQNCIDRLGNNANFMLSHATQTTIVANNQTKGNRLYSASQGNETNLKDPLSVVMGGRRIYGMLVVVYRKDLNNNDPEHGFIFLILEGPEGPVDALIYPEVSFGGDSNPADPFNFNYRLGLKGQTPMDSALTIHSYSSTSLIRARSGWVDPETIEIGSIKGSVFVYGLNNIRVYSDADTYTEEWTTNRVWQIARMLCDKRWGYGFDYERLNIESFIEAAEWVDTNVRFTDFNGDIWDHKRATSNVELRPRKIQQQIEDMCLAGRLSRPFIFDGKIHIVPLKNIGDSYAGIVLEAEGISTSEIELTWTAPSITPANPEDIPYFTDEGPDRNIIHEKKDGGWRTTLRRSRISDLDLPNRVECTFDDGADRNLERPLRPIEDIDAQLKAGRIVGDHSKKQNIKKFNLAGIVEEGHALKVATSLLDLGPFDEGGLQNNLKLKFKIWYLDSLDLHQEKVIRVGSSQITRYGFQYFRVKNMKRANNLHVELTVQAYNETYMANFEQVFGTIPDPPDDPEDPPPTPPAPPTDPMVFGDISYDSGVLTINSEATV